MKVVRLDVRGVVISQVAFTHLTQTHLNLHIPRTGRVVPSPTSTMADIVEGAGDPQIGPERAQCDHYNQPCALQVTSAISIMWFLYDR